MTATRLPLRLSEVTAATTLIDGVQLQNRPVLGLDEALRWAAGFSLFRRTPGRAAHPTAQGVNLRGIAPSGTSRALVLFDGIPLTDAFGGWVYWSRVPLPAIQQVEIVPGGTAAPYGNQALSGVIQLVGRRPPSKGHELQVRVLAGEQSSFDSTVLVAGSAAGVGLLLSGEVFSTGGYVAVAAEERGTIDTPVASAHRSGLLRLELPARITLTLDGLRETRDNGTPERTNSTTGYGFAAAWSSGVGSSRGSSLHLFSRRQVFSSRFSSVSAARDSERAVLDQRVPSIDLGAGGHLWRALGDNGVLSAGGDWRRVSGRSEETVLAIGLRREPGGTQNAGGVFVSTHLRPAPAWGLDLSLRLDAWHNDPRAEGAAARSEATLSPRLGLLWRPHRSWTVRTSAYGAFRAPTLNELYRQFRVGNVVTRANDELVHERLVGLEAGVEFRNQTRREGFRARLTVYHNRLDDAVVNATIGEAAGLIFRQRRNLGSAGVTGAELDARLQSSHWSVGLSAAWIRSRVRRDPVAADAAPLPSSIIGNRLPQVPDYRVRLSGSYHTARWNALLALHAVGRQFEDDRNSLPLGAAATVDAAVGFTLSPAASLTLRAQNVFGHRLQVGRTPVVQLGPPRTVVLALDLSLSS